jgi:hypothetical protein
VKPMRRARRQAGEVVSLKVPLWERLRDVRQAVSDGLSKYPDELRLASMMTASELAENALKYGLDVQVTMELRPRVVAIHVTNAVVSVERVAAARAQISRLARETDPASLYMARMAELLEDDNESGSLGLYRVAGEGKFRLSCTYRNRRLTITAKRKIHAAPN